jgi:hypothetical protein
LHSAVEIRTAPRLGWARIARRIRVPLSFLLAALYCWLAQPNWLSLAIAAAVIAVGLAIRASASGHIRKDRELTTTGPYAYTRNPLYLGSLLMGIGFAIASRSLWIVLALAMLLAGIYWPLMHAEEVYLRTHFPGYDDYARSVPRLFPRFRMHLGAGGGFSTALYLKHREYQALIGAVAVMLFLIAKILWWPR